MWFKKKTLPNIRMDTLIGRNTVIEGDICFSGGLHIEGRVKGNIYTDNDDKAMLSLGKNAHITGNVVAPFIIINGAIIGEVRSQQHIVLREDAKIDGDVYYKLIEVAIGVAVNGLLVSFDEGEQDKASLPTVNLTSTMGNDNLED